METSQTSISPNVVRHEDVYWDCYTWLGEIRKRGGIPITGIFRTAQILNRYFRPAYVWDGEDLDRKFDMTEILRLSAYLGQNIYLLRPETMHKDVRGFISLGVEQTPPALSRKVKHRIAILHDCMAADSVFGSLSRTRFNQAIGQNNVYLYVSETSRIEFDKRLAGEGYTRKKRNRTILPFPQCHHFKKDEVRWNGSLIEHSKSLSVHSLFSYKNHERLIEVVKRGNFLKHTHVGQSHLTPTELHKFRGLIHGNHFKWDDKCDDARLKQHYQENPYFFCLSKREGFSLPPMEAILNGAHFVTLSAIPAHLEVYGEYNVNFTSPDLGAYRPNLAHLHEITRADRVKLFRRHTPENMMAALLNLLK